MSNTAVVPSADPTSIESVRETIQASSEAYIAFKNADLTSQYKQAVANATAQIQNGAQNVTWPDDPFAYELAPADGDGFVFYQISKATHVVEPPVPMPALKPKDLAAVVAALPSNQISIGAQLGDTNFYAVNFDDTWPLNKKTPPMADGHVYIKIPAPVGTVIITLADGTKVAHGGWYEQVS